MYRLALSADKQARPTLQYKVLATKSVRPTRRAAGDGLSQSCARTSRSSPGRFSARVAVGAMTMRAW